MSGSHKKQEGLHGLIRLCVCVEVEVFRLCAKVSLTQIEKWRAAKSRSVANDFFSCLEEGRGKKVKKKKKKARGKERSLWGMKTCVHTVLSWSTSFLDEKRATQLPHSMCFVCAAWGKSRPICFTSVFWLRVDNSMETGHICDKDKVHYKSLQYHTLMKSPLKPVSPWEKLCLKFNVIYRLQLQ